MAGDDLIQAHLAALARQLPADAVDELADGLTETWQRHLDGGLPPEEAARAAIAEFGTPARITDAFVTYAPGRRAARLLLATGPVAAACWGTGLATSHAWTWPVPKAAAVAVASLLVLAVAVLLVAATSRHSYRRTRLASAGGIAVVALDVTMLTVVVLVAPPAWSMLGGITLSLARIVLAARLLPATLAHWHSTGSS
jgi:hypothetical protein